LRSNSCGGPKPTFSPAVKDRQILEGLGRDKKLKGVYCLLADRAAEACAIAIPD